MSFQAILWAMKQRCGNPIARAVLLSLADHADAKGFAFPSQDTVADECDCTDRTVRKQLKLLESSSLIKRVKRYKKDGHRTSDGITLQLFSLPEHPSASEDRLPEDYVSTTGTDFPASILNQSLKQKEENGMIWTVKENEGPLLDRYKDDKKWKACEREMRKLVPPYMNRAHFPADVVQKVEEVQKK